MKICIYGAGAIGGYLGVQLAQAGVDVSLVARGAHLAAMRRHGLKLLIGGEERVVHPRCTDNPAELGPQDFVIICLKAHSITGVIEAMQPLLGLERASSPRSMEFPIGISTSMAAALRARRWRASIPADGSGAS
jgi:ketopantoate reductase